MSKLDLIREMEQQATNTEHMESLQSNLNLLNSELADVSTKLREASVELNKEKARYTVANQHTVVCQILDLFAIKYFQTVSKQPFQK